MKKTVGFADRWLNLMIGWVYKLLVGCFISRGVFATQLYLIVTVIHPGKLTWNLEIIQSEKEKPFSKPSLLGSMLNFFNYGECMEMQICNTGLYDKYPC